MRFYRLYNHSEGAPASALLFLRREDAERYREILLWPHAKAGTWPLSKGGELALDRVEFGAQPLELDAQVEAGLDAVVMQRGGTLGSAPLLPGDCFDPEQWLPCPIEGLKSPAQKAAWERAARALKGDHRT